MRKLLLLLLLITGISNSQIVIVNPTPLRICDINNDGFEVFNLNLKNSEIIGSLNPSNYSIAYYELLTDSQNNQNQIASNMSYTNITALQQIVFVRVWENANTSNFSLTTLSLIVNSLPEFSILNTMYVYESPYDGIAQFNLNDQTLVINNGFFNIHNVSYYNDYFDASTGVNQITNLSNYIVYFNSTLYARVQDNFLGCFKVVSFSLIVAEDSIINIPDANFKSILLSANSTNYIAANDEYGYYNNKIDLNNDGEIQLSEANKIYKLSLDTDSSTDNIFDLTGISSFKNLFYLDTSDNQVTTFDQYSLSNMINLKKLYMINCNLNWIYVDSLTNLKELELQANNLTSIEVSNLNKLTSFSPANNPLTSLNINNLVNLTSLKCYSNNLTSLDLSFFPKLSSLQCEGNQINTLDLSNKQDLRYLGCTSNLISNLNLINCPSLDNLHCENNPIDFLDLSGNHLLNFLYCSYIELTTLNLSANPKLTILQCNNNQLTTLDLSNQIILNQLNCSYNNLSSLFIKNGKIESQTTFNNNPNLKYICADELQVAIIQSLAETSTLVSTYCSFTPGGIYNTVAGEVRFDMNNNGFDTNDFLLPNIAHLKLTNGTITSEVFSNTNGLYSMYTSTGNHTLSTLLENPSYFNITPSSTAINFPVLNGSTQSQNFCISANGQHSDVEIMIVPIIAARPGFNANYKIIYKNKGNQTLSGNLGFNYDDTVLDFVSATVIPSSQSSGVLNWNYSNLLPFESNSIDLVLNLNSPMETPAVNIGDILNFGVNITPIVADEIPADNSFNYNQIVVGSFDPNDIICLEGASVASSTVGEYLHYVINFENTGNFPAENIVVKTTIDQAKFNINSLQLLNTSSPVEARINGNIVEFIFKNVQLPTGGQGRILLKIKTNNTVNSGDVVSKRADIFFDYNFPIDTGFANTVFQSLSNTVFEVDNSVSISPNPTLSKININSNNIVKSIELYDFQGRILQTILNANNLDLSDKTNGIYFLKITTEKGSKIEKVVKE